MNKKAGIDIFGLADGKYIFCSPTFIEHLGNPKEVCLDSMGDGIHPPGAIYSHGLKVIRCDPGFTEYGYMIAEVKGGKLFPLQRG